VGRLQIVLREDWMSQPDQSIAIEKISDMREGKQTKATQAADKSKVIPSAACAGLPTGTPAAPAPRTWD